MASGSASLASEQCEQQELGEAEGDERQCERAASDMQSKATSDNASVAASGRQPKAASDNASVASG